MSLFVVHEKVETYRGKEKTVIKKVIGTSKGSLLITGKARLEAAASRKTDRKQRVESREKES